MSVRQQISNKNFTVETHETRRPNITFRDLPEPEDLIKMILELKQTASSIACYTCCFNNSKQRLTQLFSYELTDLVQSPNVFFIHFFNIIYNPRCYHIVQLNQLVLIDPKRSIHILWMLEYFMIFPI